MEKCYYLGKTLILCCGKNDSKIWLEVGSSHLTLKILLFLCTNFKVSSLYKKFRIHILCSANVLCANYARFVCNFPNIPRLWRCQNMDSLLNWLNDKSPKEAQAKCYCIILYLSRYDSFVVALLLTRALSESVLWATEVLPTSGNVSCMICPLWSDSLHDSGASANHCVFIVTFGLSTCWSLLS